MQDMLDMDDDPQQTGHAAMLEHGCERPGPRGEDTREDRSIER